jgi:hypothetical protein
MRADYATSDLISKVNSDWINAVLVNHELDRSDTDDEGLLGEIGRPDSGKQIIPSWPKPAPRPAYSSKAAGPDIDIESIISPPRGRSVARRVTERLALAVALLAAVWTGVRMTPASRDTTDSISVPAPDTSSEAAVAIKTTELRPGWLLPEILYGPAMASSPISAPRRTR